MLKIFTRHKEEALGTGTGRQVWRRAKMNGPAERAVKLIEYFLIPHSVIPRVAIDGTLGFTPVQEKVD